MAIHQNPSPPEDPVRRPRDWRRGLPVLVGPTVTLRPLKLADAPSLLTHLSDPLVQEYLTPCPASIDGIRRFIRWTHDERRRGQHVCYAVVPNEERKPVGIVQIWSIERDFSTAEWGFALGQRYWGSGLFVASARLLVDFAFSTLHVRRLEARAVASDDRSNAALERLGAMREGVLREGFQRGKAVKDHIMWSLLAREWPAPEDKVGQAD